jgi:hypothetical protein
VLLGALTLGARPFTPLALVACEEQLPRRFGGGPTDYQLVGSEDAGGRPRLSLLVDPGVGPVDLDDVADTFLEGLSRGQDNARVMALLWREAGLLQVERRSPIVAASGKILHLHVAG